MDSRQHPRTSRSDSSIAQIEAQIRHHNYAYFVLNKPEISDAEFDQLVEKLRLLAPDSPVLAEVGSDLDKTSKKVKHKRPMLSLDKCYDFAGFHDWFEKIQGSVISMPKIDGVACSIHYKDGHLSLAATRGDGKEGEDITGNVLRITSIPHQVRNDNTLEVRGEVYLRLSRFKSVYEEQFSNPRNLAAGALKQKDPGKSQAYGLSFFAYDIDGTTLKTEAEKFAYLQELGFDPLPIQVLESSETAEKIYRDFQKQRQNLDYEIDGVVFRANQVSEQTRLGVTAHHPKWSIAYKFQGESAHTQLTGVEWSLGRTGVITPVAIVEPVWVSGAMVSRASLHNLTQFQTLNLTNKAVVEIVRRGGVIPHIEQVIESVGNPVDVPNDCPSCHRQAVIDGEFLCCPEPETCPDIIASRLIHFASVLELEGFGDKIVRNLIQSGLLKQPVDFFKLHLDDLLKLDRIGEKLAEKLLAQVEQKRSISLPVFLTALGFDELGPSIAEILANHFKSLEAVRKAKPEEFTQLFGIGESIAHSVAHGFKAFSIEIDALLQEVRVESSMAVVHDTSHPLFGKSVVFTGTLTQLDRKEAQKKVRALGGHTPSSISAQTDFLVVGDGPISSKQKSAQKLGIRVISEVEFIEALSGSWSDPRSASLGPQASPG